MASPICGLARRASTTTIVSSGSIDAISLDGFDGIRLTGISDSDQAGRSVSDAGDVNGDGIADLLIGAPYGDGGGSNSGESYVIFGNTAITKSTTATLRLGDLDGNLGFTITGLTAGDRLGYAVAIVGDINGDGFADLLVGADSGDPPGGGNAGESYVVFGSATVGASGSVDLSSSALNGANGFVLNGIDASDYSGARLAPAGDVNGDGALSSRSRSTDALAGRWSASRCIAAVTHSPNPSGRVAARSPTGLGGVAGNRPVTIK